MQNIQRIISLEASRIFFIPENEGMNYLYTIMFNERNDLLWDRYRSLSNGRRSINKSIKEG